MDDQELSSSDYATTKAVAQTHGAGLGLTLWLSVEELLQNTYILNTFISTSQLL